MVKHSSELSPSLVVQDQRFKDRLRHGVSGSRVLPHKHLGTERRHLLRGLDPPFPSRSLLASHIGQLILPPSATRSHLELLALQRRQPSSHLSTRTTKSRSSHSSHSTSHSSHSTSHSSHSTSRSHSPSQSFSIPPAGTKTQCPRLRNSSKDIGFSSRLKVWNPPTGNLLNHPLPRRRVAHGTQRRQQGPFITAGPPRLGTWTSSWNLIRRRLGNRNKDLCTAMY